MAGNDSVYVKFGPEGTDPNTENVRFTFHTRRAMQSAIADLLAAVFYVPHVTCHRYHVRLQFVKYM